MAFGYSPSVLLGFEDEPILEKHEPFVGFYTNKIGGKPNWAIEGLDHPQCTVCGLEQILVVQMYAPLDGSLYHRILYIFCCLNPHCSNLNGGWSCIRQQILAETESNVEAEERQVWCSGANDWPSDDDDNGNACAKDPGEYAEEEEEEEEDDTSSPSLSVRNRTDDECNANVADAGAKGVHDMRAYAEIEGGDDEEAEVITIDTPVQPKENLLQILNKQLSSLSLLSQSANFQPSFISVYEEKSASESAASDEHVQLLLANYNQTQGRQKANRQETNSDADLKNTNIPEAEEIYERELPLHGDTLFHRFISRIKINSGQIIRYCRGSLPLLMQPLNEEAESQKLCRHCQSPLVFELQLLPSLIPKLKIFGEPDIHVEFGSVLIYTCLQSCWSPSDVTHREEFVLVQTEE